MNAFDYFFEISKNLDKNFIEGKVQISFQDLFDRSMAMAAFIRKSIGTKTNIIILEENSIRFVMCYLAILKSGNTCIPLYSSIEKRNFSFIKETTQAAAVFYGEKASWVQQLMDAGQLFSTTQNYECDQVEDQLIKGEVTDKKQVAEIVFTSGSTGDPKGVEISHQNIISNTSSIISYLDLTQSDKMCVVLPFHYCYGLSLLHTHLRVGGSLVLNNTFMFVKTVIDDLINYECTGFAGVPSHFQLLLNKSQSFKSTKFPVLRYVTQAGGRLHNKYIKEFAANFPNIDFYVMYGQTEATARLSYLEPDKVLTKLGSIGKPIPGVRFRIVDADGQDVFQGDTGELIAAGENVMLGYYNDDAGTKSTIRNGWLHTGDLAHRDKDGYYFIESRMRDFVKIGGNRVSMKEIENVVVSSPFVQDCVVQVLEDELLGEKIHCKVLLKDGAEKEGMKSNLLRHCKGHLISYKIPQSIEFIETIHITASGKIKR